MLMDTLGFVHGTGSSVQGPMSVTAAGVYGDTICAGGGEYSALELDLGAPGSASTYPYMAQFPSYTEQGYTYPPAMFDNSIQWGLHIMITAVFTTSTSILFYICSSATTNATYTSNPIVQRSLTAAAGQMAVLGATYFMGVNVAQILEFNRFYATPTGGNPGAGKILAWFGPKTGSVL